MNTASLILRVLHVKQAAAIPPSQLMPRKMPSAAIPPSQLMPRKMPSGVKPKPPLPGLGTAGIIGGQQAGPVGVKKASLIVRIASLPGHVKSAEGILDSVMQGDLQGAGSGIASAFGKLDPHVRAAVLGGLGGGALGLVTGHPIKGVLGGAAAGAGGYAALGEQGAFRPEVMKMLAAIRGEESPPKTAPTGASMGDLTGDSALTAPPASVGTLGGDLGSTPASLTSGALPNGGPKALGGYVPNFHAPQNTALGI